MLIMKRIIFSLIFILFFTNTIHAAIFNWKKISTSNESGSNFYLDKKTSFKVGAYTYYWMLTNIYDDEDKWKSSITHNMVNCNTNENKYITITTFAKHWGQGRIIVDAVVPEEAPDIFVWEKFPKGSTQGAVIEEVC